MTDLIYTINSDDEVPIDEEESSDEEITVVTEKQRQKKKAEAKIFNPAFVFEHENTSMFSTSAIDDAISSSLKKRQPRTTVEEKISELRSQKANKEDGETPTSAITPKTKVFKIDVEDIPDEVEDDEELVEVVKDTLRLKLKKGKNKLDEEDINASVIPLAQIKDSSSPSDTSVSWNPDITFTDMNLSRPLLKAISGMNYQIPTPIQQAAIPISLMGRDVCACAATGTGKTAAFMLPVLERLINRPATSPTTRVLCLLPTRELAVQVYTVSKQLAEHTSIRVCLAAGGMDLKSQEASLRTNPDIVVATPGRLIDHLHNAVSFSLNQIEILILDEADRMLDEYFLDQMKEIVECLPKQRQTLLFSATLSEEVESLVELKKPVRIFVNSNTDVAPFLRQEFIRVRENKEGDREAIVAALCSRSFLSNVVIFSQTKKQAHRMHILLGLLGLNAAELHGDLCQGDRLKSLNRFKRSEADVLVCTDVASRGLDIPNVKTVINLTMPNTQQHYVHRVGRTARAGKFGRSVSLVGETERKLLKQIVKFAKTPVKSRVVPAEVINKYREKLEELEPEIGEVMRMEANERKILSTENQMNRAEKLIKGEDNEKRAWFQKRTERQIARVERMLGAHSNVKGSKKKGANNNKKGAPTKGGPSTSGNADDRMQLELEKSQQYRQRMEKKKRKPKRARACVEPEAPAAKKAKKQGNQKTGFFDKELTNISKKSVKKFRHIPNKNNHNAAGKGKSMKKRR